MNKLSTTNARELRRKLRHDQPFHLPPGAQPLRATVRLTLDGVTTQPIIVLTDTREAYTWRVAMSRDGDAQWSAHVMLPSEPTIVTYVFEIKANGNAIQIMEQRQVEGRNTPVYGQWMEQPYKIAVYDPMRMPAEWTQGMLMYQIFPDRFARANPDAPLSHPGVYGHEPLFKAWGSVPEAPPLGRDFYGGNLRGVIDQLDYLKDLGVECLYFNPIFEAATNHRYEAIDFLKIDPMLGTDADFDELVEQAHARGIRIMLDAVFNHCSSDSVYFDITGKHTTADGIGAYQSRQSPYYRWFNFQNWPHEYDGWIGFGFMPEFVECPEMEDFFLGPDGVTAYWLDKGVDGWRCDVAYDNTETFWRRFRKAVDDAKRGAYLVSEEWRDSSHYLLGDSFNATMNYRFTWAVRGFIATDDLKPSELDDRLMTWMRDTPQPAIKSQMNLLDSHDTDRLMTVCKGDRRRYKQALAFLLAYPGAPSVYYGTETGIEGSYAEDGRRTMPWDNLDQDLLDFIKVAIAARGASPALRLGDIETVVIDDELTVYAFTRRHEGKTVVAVFNGSDRDATVAVPLRDNETGTFRDLLGLHPAVEVVDGHLTFTLPGRSMVWYGRG